jgi:DDE superfamily endonuclease
MEDVLDLYAEEPDPSRPVVCFDESPTQLIGENRQPIPAAPGQIERYDYEYKRNGSVNLFVFFDAHRPWRKVKVTQRRGAEDYAQCMRELVDVHYPNADYVRIVQDNLSTHSAGALYQTFPPAEARRILRRLEFHYTPKHGRDQSAAKPMPRQTHRYPGSARSRDRRLGMSAQCLSRSHQMDVHNR